MMPSPNCTCGWGPPWRGRSSWTTHLVPMNGFGGGSFFCSFWIEPQPAARTRAASSKAVLILAPRSNRIEEIEGVSDEVEDTPSIRAVGPAWPVMSALARAPGGDLRALRVPGQHRLERRVRIDRAAEAGTLALQEAVDDRLRIAQLAAALLRVQVGQHLAHGVGIENRYRRTAIA